MYPIRPSRHTSDYSLNSLVAGGAVSRVDPNSTGLNPAWRKALAYAVTEITWDEGTPSSEINAMRTDFKTSMAKLEGLAPGSGAYLNEVTSSISFSPSTLNLTVLIGVTV